MVAWVHIFTPCRSVIRYRLRLEAQQYALACKPQLLLARSMRLWYICAAYAGRVNSCSFVGCVPLQDAAHGTGQHSPHAQASADTLAMVAVPAQQQAGLPWHGDGGRALIRNWPDGSTFSKEAAAIATATAAAATAAAAAAEASSSTSPEDHCSQPEDFATPASEQQPDLPNKAQVSPAAQGEQLQTEQPPTHHRDPVAHDRPCLPMHLTLSTP